MTDQAPRINRVYLAGPISGNPHYRETFARYTDLLLDEGYEVFNPAADPEIPGWQWADYLKRDIPHLLQCDAVAVLPGWTESKGASLEVEIAHRLGMPILYYSTFVEGWVPFTPPMLDSPPSASTPPRTILEEAQDLTSGDRNQTYGPPLKDYQRTVDLFRLLTGVELTPEQGIMFMICVKLSRQAHLPKRDNLVDLCGYAHLLDQIMETA